MRSRPFPFADSRTPTGNSGSGTLRDRVTQRTAGPDTDLVREGV